MPFMLIRRLKESEMISMNNIRMIVAMYQEYYYMWKIMMPATVALIDNNKNTSRTFKRLTSNILEKMYVSYLNASDAYYEMQENNPNWKETMMGYVMSANEAESDARDDDISGLLAEIKVIVAVYTERRKLLDMINIIVYAAEKEENISSYFIPTVNQVEKTMTDLYLDSLLAFHEKRKELTRLKTNPEEHFDRKLLYIIKDMDEHDYVYSLIYEYCH